MIDVGHNAHGARRTSTRVTTRQGSIHQLALGFPKTPNRRSAVHLSAVHLNAVHPKAV